MTETVVANFPQGKIVGTHDGTVCRFSAIPYALAPVDSLRFCPPEPYRWTHHLDATRLGSIAPQLPSRLSEAMGDFEAPQSEDCLHLTIWTPATDRRRRPVLVWLHGGAWQSGAGALDWYSGARLAAREDIVVVCPNYRLGPLGWMAIDGATANLGLLDQEAAIDWTIDHIEAFGGDPENITVMGQSAGAMNIACMLMRQPRFQRGILQSPSLGRGFRSLEKAHEIADIFLHAAGAGNLDKARQLPVSSLLAAQRAQPVVQWLANENAQRGLFCPVADGQVLPKAPNEAFKTAAGHVDVIIGYTQDEMTAFPGGSFNAESKALGDEIYGARSRQWATDAVSQGRKAWSYQFNHRPNDVFGACHCIELPFVFDTLGAFAAAPMLKGIHPEHAKHLVDDIQSSWGAFIREGDPGWAPWPSQKIFS